MKAKEYAQRIIDALNKYGDVACDEVIEVLTRVVADYINEISEITKARNPETASGLVSIIKELRQKYVAMCRILENKYGKEILKKDGFDLMIEAELPDLYKDIKLMEIYAKRGF